MTIQNSACLVTADQEFAKINTLTVINCLIAWRKPYQDLQDFRIYRMRDSVVNSSDRCGKLSESGGYRATCTELAEVSRDNIQDVIDYCLDPRLLREIRDMK